MLYRTTLLLSQSAKLSQAKTIDLRRSLAAVDALICSKIMGLALRNARAERQKLTNQLSETLRAAQTAKHKSYYKSLPKETLQQRSRINYHFNKSVIRDQRLARQHGVADRRYLRQKRYLDKLSK